MWITIICPSFTGEEIAGLHESLVNILMEALHNPDRPLCRLAVLGREEREKVLYTFNNTEKYLEEKDLYQVFEQTVSDYPQRVAGYLWWEKADLFRAGRAGGRCFRGLEPYFRGRKRGGGHSASPHLALFAALMGTLRSGNAYLLLSTELPAGRIGDIYRRSGAGVLYYAWDAGGTAWHRGGGYAASADGGSRKRGVLS